jgi:uncharacterized membrane protein YdjX (TVP38/TMEM64 family)
MKKILTPILVLAVLVLLWIFRQPILASLAWISDREAIATTVQKLGIWGPVVLFILLVLQVFLAFIPGQALMITCSYLYGFWAGMFISWFSLVVGGEVAFMLARRYGRPFAEHWVEAETLSRWDKTAIGQGIVFYTFSLVLPIFPNDAMCYVGGLANITPRRFLLANMFGRGIACLLASIVGAFGSQIPVWGWVLAVVILLVLCIGWIVKKRYLSNGSDVRERESNAYTC